MKKIVLFTALLLSCLCSIAQKASNVNFTSLKKTLEDSPKLYEELLDRFTASDTTLSIDDYYILYYGQCLKESYNPYGADNENFDKFKKHYQTQDYEKALPIALKMIKKDPFNMQMTFKTAVCYHYLKDEVNKVKMLNRYDNIMLTIFESGDGKTEETAFVVMRVNDEYELMSTLKVENTSQSLVGYCDMMSLKENELGIDKLYFNVSKLFESMKKMFKGK